MRNNRFLQDIVHGSYGRKIAYTDYEVVDESNILDVLADTMGIFYRNREVAQYLWDYKNGDQPILYRQTTLRSDVNNPIVENHAYEFVQFGVSQTYGEPLQYVSLKKDDEINKAVENFNSIMAVVSKAEKNVSQGEWKVATGTSFLSLKPIIDGKKPFFITVPTPLNTYIVYQSQTEEPLVAFQMFREAKGQNYWKAFTNNKIFTIKNSKIVRNSEGKLFDIHVFGAVPIVEVPNNQDRLSDVELVINITDAINNMQSQRMDAVEQFVQSWIKFTNCEISYEDLTAIRQNGAIIVPPSENGANADVDFINQELNQSETQVAKEDLLDNALSILAIPSKQGNTGGDTQGAVELRNGWDFSKGRARLKDVYVASAEKRFAEIALTILRIQGKDLHLESEDFEVHINHSPTDNLIIKAQALEYLLKNGIHPLVAIKACGIWGDAEKTYNMSKPYLDKLFKIVDDANIDVEEQTKKATLLMQLLNAGVTPDEASKQSGMNLDIENNPNMTSKWSYEQ